jgi:hypothetical protein
MQRMQQALALYMGSHVEKKKKIEVKRGNS